MYCTTAPILPCRKFSPAIKSEKNTIHNNCSSWSLVSTLNSINANDASDATGARQIHIVKYPMYRPKIISYRMKMLEFPLLHCCIVLCVFVILSIVKFDDCAVFMLALISFDSTKDAKSITCQFVYRSLLTTNAK